MSIGRSDNYTGPSLNKNKEKCTNTHDVFDKNLAASEDPTGVFELRLMMRLAAGVCETGAPGLCERDKPSLGNAHLKNHTGKARHQAQERSYTVTTSHDKIIH